MSFNIEEKIKNIYGENYAGRNKGQIDMLWSWYSGYNEHFHNYRVYNGENFIYLTKKSLQMAKKVAETWADLLINEKCDVKMDEKGKLDLDVLFNETKFWTKANKSVELGFALGYSALVGEISKDRKMRFVTIDARNIIPLKIENDEITECAFYKNISGNRVRLTLWTKNETGHYTSRTLDYNQDGQIVEGSDVKLETKMDKPLYMIIRPNIVDNNVSYNFGTSVFANSIDTLKAIDTKYDGFDFEFIGGRKKVYVSVDAMKIIRTDDGQSSQVKPFDPLDSVYYNLGDGHDGDELIKEGGGELRSEQYISSLNFELGILSEKTGLGYGYFKFDTQGFATATQVISENSDLFRTLVKHEILIKDEMIQFVQAVIEYSNEYCDIKVNHYKPEEIDILFDDSIIEDKETQKENDLKLVDKGLMTHVDFAIKWEALNEDDAIRKYMYLDISRKATTLMPLIHTRMITPEKAIELIYGEDVENKEKLIEYFNLDDLNIDDGEFDE